MNTTNRRRATLGNLEAEVGQQEGNAGRAAPAAKQS